MDNLDETSKARIDNELPWRFRQHVQDNHFRRFCVRFYILCKHIGGSMSRTAGCVTHLSNPRLMGRRDCKQMVESWMAYGQPLLQGIQKTSESKVKT
jgi:hypothetical protein